MGGLGMCVGLLDLETSAVGVLTHSKPGDQSRGGVIGSVKLVVVNAEKLN
jgi:hypothetical protein